MLLVLATLPAATPGGAAIHACPTAAGGTQFQDRPCAVSPRGAAPARGTRRESGTSVAALETPPPLGIDPSWFARPARQRARAAVRRSRLRVRRGAALVRRRARARGGRRAVPRRRVASLRGGPRGAGRARRGRGVRPTRAHRHRRTPRARCSCRRRRSRATPRRCSGSCASVRASRGISAGDTPLACDGFDPAACAHYESLQLYERMSADARALGAPRRSILAAEPTTTRSATTDPAADGS